MLNAFFDKNKALIALFGVVLGIMSFILNIPEPKQESAIIALSHLTFLFFFLLCILLLIIFFKFHFHFGQLVTGERRDEKHASFINIIILNVIFFYGIRIAQDLWVLISSMYKNILSLFLSELAYVLFFLISLVFTIWIIFGFIKVFKKYINIRWSLWLDVFFLGIAICFSLFLYFTLLLSFSTQTWRFSLVPIKSIVDNIKNFLSFKPSKNYITFEPSWIRVFYFLFVTSLYSWQKSRLRKSNKEVQKTKKSETV